MGTRPRGPGREQLAVDVHLTLRRTAHTLSALEAPVHLGPLCQRDLAAKPLRSTGDLTTVVDNLGRDGLVERRRDSDDRRVVTVQLTDRGRTLVDEVSPQHVTAAVDWFAVLEPEEQRRLAVLLRRVDRQGHHQGATGGAVG